MSVPPAREGNSPGGDDPWAAFGYLVAGVLFYGVLGWLLSVWLDHAYWVPIGLLAGLGLGMYMVFARYRFHEPTDDRRDNNINSTSDDPDRGPRSAPPDDRGDSE
jgi:ATP synthase protein I